MSVTRTRPALSAATFAAPVLTLLTVTPLLAMALVGAPTPARAAGPAATHAVAQPVAAPQPPGPNVFIEVSPSTVEPGHLVGLRASCQDNSVGAIAVSDAFGRVAVQPQRGLLTGTAQVKDRVLPGNYRVKLECRGGRAPRRCSRWSAPSNPAGDRPPDSVAGPGAPPVCCCPVGSR